jgi:Kef-type K+ transport system membrane component KefB
MKSPNKRLIIIMMAVAIILCIPLIAMQFTDEVNWTLSDFVVMGLILLSTGLLCELVLRKVTKIQHRIILCALLIFGLFIVWAELAVGIFGTPFAGN